MNTENRSLNIIVAGKSGVGKSSFLNYLVGSEVFKTGVGEPVTQNYFGHTPFVHPETNVHYNLYDTKGIEPQTTTEFKRVVIDMVKDRGKAPNVFYWIHSLYYCIAASSKRIEPFEADFIRNISQYVHVVVLLTKSDLVKPEDITSLSSEIKRQVSSSDIEIVPVCSVEVETRRGKSVKSGRNRVLAISFNGLWVTIAKNRPAQLFGKIRKKEYIPDINKQLSNSAINQILNTIYIDYKNKKFKLEDLRNLHKYGNFAYYLLKPSLEKFFKDINYSKTFMPSNFDEEKRFFETIFKFYADVTLQKPRSFTCNNVSNAYFNFKNHNIDINRLSCHFSRLETAEEDYNKCWLFDGKELKYLENVRKELISLIEEEVGTFLKLMDDVVYSYKIELQSYGEYCLKNNGFDSCGNKINSEKDLLASEQIYYNQVLLRIADGYIDDKERNYLNTLRNDCGISEYRAEAIETFARSKNPNAVK